MTKRLDPVVANHEDGGEVKKKATARRKTMGRNRLAAALITILCLSQSGCGDDNSSNESGKSGSGGQSNTGGESGSGGQSNTGGESGAGGTVDTSCNLAAPEDLQDYYLLSMSLNISPRKPIVALVEITIDEGRSVTLSIQPLVSNDGKSPVGAPILGGPYPVAEDGSLIADLGKLTIEGAANPISGGSHITSTVVLAAGPGSICKPADLVCGALTGIVDYPIKGLDLNGSTFTLQRITDATSYPGPVLNCAGDEP